MHVLSSKSDLFQLGVGLCQGCALFPILFVIYMDSILRRVTECEAAGMKISTSKSEAMVLGGKPVDCLLQMGNESLPQVKELKFLCVLFTSEGMIGREIDQRV